MSHVYNRFRKQKKVRANFRVVIFDSSSDRWWNRRSSEERLQEQKKVTAEVTVSDELVVENRR